MTPAGYMDQCLAYESILADVRRLMATDEHRFVARVNTPWTLIGLEAWLSTQPRDVRGVVIVMPSSKRDEARVPRATSESLRKFHNVAVFVAHPFTDVTYRRRNIIEITPAGTEQ